MMNRWKHITSKFAILSLFSFAIVGAVSAKGDVTTIQGECIKIQCFDGSLHDCDFNCNTITLEKPECSAVYVDPMQSESGYAAWCACQGGTVYNDERGYDCQVRSESSNSCHMSYRPAVKQAKPIKHYRGAEYMATMFSEIVSAGRVQYLYILEVTKSGVPCFYVASEINIFSPPGKGPYFLGVFSGNGHGNYGLSDDWGDLDLFEAKALEIVQRYLLQVLLLHQHKMKMFRFE